VKSHPNAGQFKLKGRKEKMLSCRCCWVLDLREQEQNKEIKEYVYESIQHDLGFRSGSEDQSSNRETREPREDH